MRATAYLVPFLDHRVVAEAMTVPLPLKHAGRFEAQLLNIIDPSLARRPSAYWARLRDATQSPASLRRVVYPDAPNVVAQDELCHPTAVATNVRRAWWAVQSGIWAV